MKRLIEHSIERKRYRVRAFRGGEVLQEVHTGRETLALEEGERMRNEDFDAVHVEVRHAGAERYTWVTKWDRRIERNQEGVDQLARDFGGAP
jgi:hypothetical protein